MYTRGRTFIGAAMLVRQKTGYEYVVLHLLCQGIELILKALLLYRDYDKYRPILKSRFRHNLVRAAECVNLEFGRKPLKPKLLLELKELNDLYNRNLLRYGNAFDLFFDPAKIASDLVLRKVFHTVKLIDRFVLWEPTA